MNLKEIGEKRQKRRKETDLYKVKEDTAKPKFYVLDMFPYPSGAGLHVGHPKGYIASDTLARKKMLQGFNVLHPMGFDTFGLGTENYAIEHKMKPQDVAKQNIENYIKQLEMFGTTYDRSRSVNTADPEYFKRTQRVFLQMYNHYYDEKLKKAMPITDPSKQQRLAYVDYKPINRCPHCMTGLANEDLDDGKCERCGSEVEQKPMKQRLLRITKYAERLLEGLDTLHREESMKDLERNRIGRSEGTEFKMKVFIPENEAENTGEGMSDTKRKLSKESNDGTYDIIGIAMKVHKELGPGLQEKIYQKGLKKLLEKNGFKVEEEKKIKYKIDGEKIGYGSVDLLVNGTIAIELKSRKILEGDFYKQLRTYINQSNTITCGFLMNFYNGKLDYKRLEKDYLEGGSKKFLSNSQIVSQKSSEILSNSQDDSLEFGVYTTRIDTVFGMSFVAIAPEHPLVEKITTKEFVKDVEKYKDAAKKKTQLERTELQKEKTGVFCGAYAINPFNNEKVPVFVADYVLANYGTGVVMAVPAHDERDFEFAKKYGLPITQSIAPFIIEKHDKEGYTTNHIDSFTSIIKHRSEDKYLLIKFQNNKFGFVGGKPDGDETKVDTLRREIVEETGYTDFEIKEAILEHAFGLGYKPHKDRIDQCHDKVFLVHLLSDKNIGVSEEEKTKHSTQRATKEEINDLILVDHHQFYWDTYIKGPSAFTEKGILVDSGEFTGMTSEEAIPAMQKRLEKKKIGGVKVNYKMQDRVFSRQRYWGEPFPILWVEDEPKISINFYEQKTWKAIVDGVKTLETRALNPEEPERFFGDVQVGDVVKCNNKETGESIYVKITHVHQWKSLEALWNADRAIIEKIYANKKTFAGIKTLEAFSKGRDFQAGYLDKINTNGLVGREFEIVEPTKKIIALNETELPLLLPDVDNYEPTGTEEGPLANITDWVNVTLPDGTKAKRETNTMPGRAGSSWYWLRYMDPTNDKALVGKDKEKYRGNVDVYIGGAEHVTRHMIYGRFWQKFLYDIGAISHDEPFQEYHYVGLIMGEDGRKMSKRRGNVVNPDDIISQFGADTLRTYEMFMGPFDQAIAWNTAGISGTKKFLDKVQNLLNKITPTPSLAKRGEADGKPPASTPHQAGLKEVLNEREAEDSIETQILLNQTIKKVGENIDEFKFNTAISQLMILTNHLTEVGTLSRTAFETLVILLSPFAPHLAEELWEQLGNEYSIFTKATWPKYDEKLLVADTITIAVQVNGKVRGTISLGLEADEQEAMAAAKADEKINNRITSEPKKVIYVKGKILNIVV